MLREQSIALRAFNTVEPVTTFYRDLFPYLDSVGWSVEVIISRTEYREGRDFGWLKGCIKARWAPSFGMEVSSLMSRLIIQFFYITYAIMVSLFGRKVHINLFFTQPPIFFSWGAFLKLIRKQPFCIVLMDVYPDVFVKAGVISENSLLRKLFSRISVLGFDQAEMIIVIGRCMYRRVLDMGVDPAKIHFIPNWVDEASIKPISFPDNEIRYKRGWQEKFVIMYSGNIGISHYFSDILEVARELQGNHSILFVFIGHGQRRSELQDYKDRYKLDNIQLLPFQPQGQLATSLSSGNIHFISLNSSFTGLVVPSKAYGVMAVGRPIIYQGEVNGEIARMIDEEDIGHIVGVADKEDLKNTILLYANNNELVARQGYQARKVLEEKYSKNKALESYYNILSAAVTLKDRN